MKFILKKSKPTRARVDVLGIFVFSEDKNVSESTAFLPAPLKREVLKLAEKAKFKGGKNTRLLFHTHSKLRSFLVVFSGMGSVKDDVNTLRERVRNASARVVQSAGRFQAKSVGFEIPETLCDALKKRELATAIVEGAELGSYAFTKYKKGQKSSVKEVVLLDEDKSIKIGIQKGKALVEGTILARDLVNEPGAAIQPKDLKEAAEEIAGKNTSVSLTTFNKKKLQQEGFGGILAVSQGSDSEPYLLHLKYEPKEKTDKKVAIVGKGITFDSGGLSLKPAEAMDTMKIDMAGAASVLGLFAALPKLKPNVEVHGIIATSENMPSATAIRPGDIVTQKNGKTVEILNTDAEGRIILADALSYAREQQLDTIIDLATLTGACIVALGNNVAALFGNNKELVAALTEASEKTGEKVWELPLEESYKNSMKSDIADLRNISKIKGAGTITAAHFLANFVGSASWAHLDIAGPSYAERPINAYTRRGGTGFGVRMLMAYIEGL